MKKLAEGEFYELKKAMVEANLAGLKAQTLQAEVQAMLLELAKKYDCIGKPLSINFDTGEIVEQSTEG